MSDADGSLLNFPTDLAVKVFGRNDPNFRDAVIEIVEAKFGKAYTLTELESTRASYVSLTVSVHVESRAQADALYQALVANELVLMTL
jgi:putative lipoic acid-binding regulatory protein